MANQVDFVIWGDGNSNNQYSQRKYRVVPSDKQILKLYAKDDALLSLTTSGLNKEGRLKFEKKGSASKRKVDLKANTMTFADVIISDIAVGKDHVIILTQQRQIFTWGDNYYGQLGLGNFMVPTISEPQLVKTESIDQIMAFENNSFAIDMQKKLWVWGKSDYLGVNFNSNLFKPYKFNTDHDFSSIKVNDGRIIAKTTFISDVPQEVEAIKDDEDESELEDTVSENLKPDSNTVDTMYLNHLKKIETDITVVLKKLAEGNPILENIREIVLR